jgi:hypothetical protein
VGESIVRALAIEQRRRLVAGVMNATEASTWWGKLTPAERSEYRQMVMDKIGVYHDFMLDIIKVGGDDQMVGEESLALIQRVHDSLRRIEMQLRQEPVGG